MSFESTSITVEAISEYMTAYQRCGLCELFPGNWQVCKERGKKAHCQHAPCRSYKPKAVEKRLSEKLEYAESRRKKNRRLALEYHARLRTMSNANI